MTMAASVGKGVLAMVLVFVVMARSCEGAINCGTVTSALTQCGSYLIAGAAVPSNECCGGVRSLNGAARETPDRRTACQCLKNLFVAVRPNLAKAQSLPSKCGVNLGIDISPSVNCNAIN